AGTRACRVETRLDPSAPMSRGAADTSVCATARWMLSAISLLLFAAAAPAAGPLKVSTNGRYFVDAATGKPFFWLGSTQWALLRGYTIDEAKLTIDKIKSKGFTVVATMLAGGPVATVPNLEGETIWLNNDPSTPNEAYFKRVDAIINYAAEQGLMLRIGMLH